MQLRPLPDRFWAKVDKSGECWLWRGTVDDHGYGRMGVAYRSVLAHRLAYELVIGPIPVGLTLDHLCRVRLCVNPAHLEPVTQSENVKRGGYSLKTHCPQGHPYDEANTYRSKTGRVCRACGRDRRRAGYVPVPRSSAKDKPRSERYGTGAFGPYGDPGSDERRAYFAKAAAASRLRRKALAPVA